MRSAGNHPGTGDLVVKVALAFPRRGGVLPLQPGHDHRLRHGVAWLLWCLLHWLLPKTFFPHCALRALRLGRDHPVGSQGHWVLLAGQQVDSDGGLIPDRHHCDRRLGRCYDLRRPGPEGHLWYAGQPGLRELWKFSVHHVRRPDHGHVARCHGADLPQQQARVAVLDALLPVGSLHFRAGHSCHRLRRVPERGRGWHEGGPQSQGTRYRARLHIPERQ
mmetsp:Transcript_74808/g.194769  ORF Transcript_74808/g.194769 Transcript_74808/m.194769 type:complete len:219 (+) Transcript_74808:469-1125(+)